MFFKIQLLRVIEKEFRLKKKNNSFPNKPWYLNVCCAGLLKTLWRKGVIFPFFNSAFYPFEEICANFIVFENVVCNLFRFQGSKICHSGKGQERLVKTDHDTSCMESLLRKLFIFSQKMSIQGITLTSTLHIMST